MDTVSVEKQILLRWQKHKRNCTHWKASIERQCQKSQFKGTEHILCSPLAITDVWRPLVTWLRIDTDPRALGASGPVQPCSRDRLWFDTLRTSLKQQPATGQPARYPPRTAFGVSASEPYWEQGFGSAAYRAQMDRWWGLLPSNPMRAYWEGRGRQVCLCSTCCPPPRRPFPPIQRPGQMPVTLILEKAETKGGKGTQLEKENAMCRYQIWSQKSAQ